MESRYFVTFNLKWKSVSIYPTKKRELLFAFNSSIKVKLCKHVTIDASQTFIWVDAIRALAHTVDYGSALSSFDIEL